RPPNWDDFDFGIWVPWWRFEYSRGFPGVEHTRAETYSGRTDAAGTHSLRIDFEGMDPPQPTNVTAEATVMDVNRQAWSSSAQVLVHPADLYVGLRTERTFYEKGQPIEVQAIVVDLDGKPMLDRPIEMKAARLEWTYKKGEWVEEEVDVQQCTVGSADKAVSCEFQTPEGGTYRITATIVDAQGRGNLTQITRWVSGGKRPTANRVEQEQVTLIPDRKEYQPGDTAEVLVQAPFVPAEGLLTLRRGGILYSERFRMDKPTYTLRIPIEEAYIPNLHVQVDLVGAAARLNSQGQPDESLPARPAYAVGGLELAVPAYSRTLSLQVRPEQTEVEPGGETVVHVDVKDAAGRAVQGAEVAVVVVDEAVLALTAYDLADPVQVFYQNRASGVSDYHSREYILLVEPELLAQEARETKAFAMPSMVPAPAAAPEMMRGAALDEAAQGAEAQPIRLRMDFNPLAVFAPSLPTDADGHAVVKVKVPDNLTRYRVMAVAVAGDNQFGKGESAI
ncbi:MAG: hypothetical protein FJ026_18705, partial [Chloroflexi bacterium]|nr:hypothetical protein [Chloroflexota bacterium]